MPQSVSATPIVHLNAFLLMFGENDADRAKIALFERKYRSDPGSFRLEDFSAWCRNQNIRYEWHWMWRKDLPVKANLWNGYTVIRWRMNEWKIRSFG